MEFKDIENPLKEIQKVLSLTENKPYKMAFFVTKRQFDAILSALNREGGRFISPLAIAVNHYEMIFDDSGAHIVFIIIEGREAIIDKTLAEIKNFNLDVNVAQIYGKMNVDAAREYVASYRSQLRESEFRKASVAERSDQKKVELHETEDGKFTVIDENDNEKKDNLEWTKQELPHRPRVSECHKAIVDYFPYEELPASERSSLRGVCPICETVVATLPMTVDQYNTQFSDTLTQEQYDAKWCD